jgi:diguanylate cyclase (GGDEF)-like protein
MAGDKRRVLRAVLPPDLSLVKGVRELAAEVGAEADLDEEHLFDIQVAVSEACANAVEHTGEETVIVAWLLPDRIIFEISSGGGFGPKAPSNGDSRMRGLGFPIMASLTDQMQVSRLPGDVTRVSLTFLLEPGADGGAKRAKLLEDPRLHGFVLTARDMRERRRLEAELRTQALHDPLTGLANRALFFDRVENALERAARHKAKVTVALVDLDDFKTVNDTFGHLAGDNLLALVGARLRTVLRAEDTAARLGGDEFAALFPDTRTTADIESAAERVLATLREPYNLGGVRLRVTASIGVAASGPIPITPKELVRQADVALYATKARGRNGWTLFHPRMERVLGA